MRELTTVADDAVVVFDGTTVTTYDGLQPATDYDFDGVAVRTLPRPGGELLARVTTVNDVHFGETECGILEGFDLGPIFTAADGDDPYPEVMNRGAIAEMTAVEPDAVVVKGDLTARGLHDEYASFVSHYGSAFADRLHVVRGNHDAMVDPTLAAAGPFVVDVPGARLALLDTVIPGHHSGQITREQLEWLDATASDSDRPVLVFGHHHPWSPASKSREAGYFGINPDDSEALIAVAARRPAIRGYFAGHTHRNRVRHFPSTGAVPWVEVACVKDFPGAWAEYRIYDGGVLQIHHRIAAPDALAWSEKTRGMFGGMYESYAFGSLADRCFQVC